MILIIGSGGNGQTYFMKELKKNFLINRVDDLDYMKHMATPLNKRNKKYNFLIKNKKITKCIFLYNDPFDSICSHFRRKWQWKQLLKLGNNNRLSQNQVGVSWHNKPLGKIAVGVVVTVLGAAAIWSLGTYLNVHIG